jgi:hypothetical protein
MTLTAAEIVMPGGPCLDIEGRYGRRYRVIPADETEYRETPVAERPWCVELRCRRGGVYPHGGSRLAAYSRAGRIGTRLRALRFVLSARGDDETVIVFEADDLPEVMAILRPYRRRQVSEAERERLRALSAVHGFPRRRISEGDSTAPESTQPPEDDPMDPEAVA